MPDDVARHRGGRGHRAAERGPLNELGRNGRQRRFHRDAEFVMQELADYEFGGAGAEMGRLQVERRAIALGAQRVEADERMGFREAGAARLHPIHRFRAVAQHDIGVVSPKPGFKTGAGHRLQSQRGHGGDVRQVFLQGEEGALPAEMQALVMRDLHEEPGPAVAAAVQLLQERDHRVVMVGTDAVQGRVVNEVVDVDGGVVPPVEAAQVGDAGGRQDHHGVDTPGLQDRVEPAEAEAGRADPEAIDLEGERARALRDAGEHALVVAHRMPRLRPVGDLDRGQHAAELLAARAPHQRHHRAGERVAFVPGGLGGRADPLGGPGVDARGAAKRIRDGGAG